MKLSFSTNGWEGCTFDAFVKDAREFGFGGIELHGVVGGAETVQGAPFHRSNAARLTRALLDDGLQLICLDSVCDLSSVCLLGQNCKELLDCIQFAHDFSIPYVRLRASDASDQGVSTAALCVERCLNKAEALGIALLVETVGAFSDTQKLRMFLERFSSDSLAALWDVHHPFFDHREDPEETIRNLGAYVRHVHVKDSALINGKRAYCLWARENCPSMK